MNLNIFQSFLFCSLNANGACINAVTIEQIITTPITNIVFNSKLVYITIIKPTTNTRDIPDQKKKLCV